MPAGQNHSNFTLITRLSAPRYDTWCKIQVLSSQNALEQQENLIKEQYYAQYLAP